MKIVSTLATAGALAVASLALSAPAHAVVETFATYTAVGGANVRYVNSGNGAGRANDATYFTITNPTDTAPGAVLVNFSFLEPLLAPFVTNVAALYTLNSSFARGNPAVGNPNFTISGFSGNFSFVTTSAITVSGPGLITTTYAAGSNLLSGTFSGGSLLGTIGGTAAATFTSGPNSPAFTYTSDFLNFKDDATFDRATSLTAINARLAITANGALRNFRAVNSGQFSSDPAPVAAAASLVPEPASWAMLVAGFGLVGASLRRRSRTVAA